MTHATSKRVCEWDGCNRAATHATDFGDIYLCRGHEIISNANHDIWGEHGITALEYRTRLGDARQWLEANP